MSGALTARELRVIALALVDDPNLDARIERDDNGIEELGRDIARRGQIDPIHVFTKGERFEAVDGQTRCIAMRRQGLTDVEAFVYPSQTLALEGVKYAANIFRTDMSAADEAKMFYELFTNECEQDIERLAALVNKNRSYVDARLQLVLGDDLIFQAVKDKKIKLGVAAELNKIDKADYRRYYLHHAIEQGVTVAIAIKWVSDYRAQHADRPQAEAPASDAQQPIITSGYDPLCCNICGQNDPRELPVMIAVHPSCRLRILEPMVAAWRGSAGGS
jgi:ParB/RepB/Spo0J family partition protein